VEVVAVVILPLRIHLPVGQVVVVKESPVALVLAELLTRVLPVVTGCPVPPVVVVVVLEGLEQMRRQLKMVVTVVPVFLLP